MTGSPPRPIPVSSARPRPPIVPTPPLSLPVSRSSPTYPPHSHSSSPPAAFLPLASCSSSCGPWSAKVPEKDVSLRPRPPCPHPSPPSFPIVYAKVVLCFSASAGQPTGATKRVKDPIVFLFLGLRARFAGHQGPPKTPKPDGRASPEWRCTRVLARAARHSRPQGCPANVAEIRGRPTCMY